MNGPTNVTLDSAGDRYYICSFGSHCQQGQRLSITVISSSANPPATATRPTTPSPTNTHSKACAPTQPNAGGPAAALDHPRRIIQAPLLWPPVSRLVY
ncbi:Blue copper protein [Striga hermonthica]|uniref:Blue copper protein n=1 Tax=Striga hermonthica TaxID=68872 RepID=A0A9N7MXK2_STRHE|nr:Blue copper protein [Striga hermonthica]